MNHATQTGSLFDQPQRMPQPKREFKNVGGVVTEHERMNRQQQIVKRAKRIGPPNDKLTIESRFAAFHRANPDIYTKLVRLARELRAKRPHYGIRPLIEIVRYDQAMTNADDGFKINNDFCSRYARLIMDNEPDLDGFFETRELKSL